jgi:hypothetical protein
MGARVTSCLTREQRKERLEIFRREAERTAKYQGKTGARTKATRG